MISLALLSQVTEQGVKFENQAQPGKTFSIMSRKFNALSSQISANIIMALNDVVNYVATDDVRFCVATFRTFQWYDHRVQELQQQKQRQQLDPE